MRDIDFTRSFKDTGRRNRVSQSFKEELFCFDRCKVPDIVPRRHTDSFLVRKLCMIYVIHDCIITIDKSIKY